jgi:SP family general alpha glucoside:H+ symporter-like MFS transporter
MLTPAGPIARCSAVSTDSRPFQLSLSSLCLSKLLAILASHEIVMMLPTLFESNFFYPYRSPWWLVSKGRTQSALKNLTKLGHKGEEGRKKLALIELTLEEIKHETEGVTYFECFRKSNLRRTIISISPLSIQVLTGITFVAGYFTYYLQIAGYSTEASFRIQIAQPVLSIVGNLMAAAIIDRVGRRNLTFYGLVILVVLLFIEGGLATGGSPGEIKGTVAIILIYSWMYNVTIGSTAVSFPLSLKYLHY